MSAQSYPESVVDILFAGAIGAIFAIYYQKIIPTPANGDYTTKLILSLIVLLIPYLLLKYTVRWHRRQPVSERKDSGRWLRHSHSDSFALISTLFIVALATKFVLEKQKRRSLLD